MDLFDTQLTPRQRINKISESVKVLNNITENSGKTKKVFRLLDGKLSSFDGCTLFIRPAVPLTGFMSSKYDKKLLELCEIYKIYNKVITYGILKRTKIAGRKVIKHNIKIIEDIIELVEPKVIVVLGEVTSELFLSTKLKVCNYHGTKIASYGSGIPVLYTYDTSWYLEHDGYEDARYKQDILHNDWTMIQEEYNK